MNKQTILTYWKEKAIPFFKTENGIKNWVVIGISLISFVLGAILF